MFFDGAAQELSSQRVVLRVRFYDVDRKALVTVKVGRCGAGIVAWSRQCGPPERGEAGGAGGASAAAARMPPSAARATLLALLASWPARVQGKQVLSDGIGRAPEEEHEVDPAAARAFLLDPARLLNLGTPLLEKLKRWAARTSGGMVGGLAARRRGS